MFQSEELDHHLKTSHTIKTESAVYVEWNLNQIDNIERVGNYRYRPQSESKYSLLPYSYDPADIGQFYTGATDSDIAIQAGFDEQNIPIIVLNTQEKMKELYSLIDCVKPYRPRSGINKLLYLEKKNSPSSRNQYIDDANADSARRPRYYMASKYDNFKYWTSFRTEYGIPTIPEETLEGSVVPPVQIFRQVERGISYTVNSINYIEDAVPFVVYKKEIPTNKIVIKMQTNVGEVDNGSARYGDTVISDPLYGYDNSTTPIRWKIQGLKNNSWEDLYSFNEFSVDSNGDPIIKADGYVEISYGLTIPDQYKDIFVFAEEISDSSLLPTYAPFGYCYLVKSSEHDLGEMYIYTAEGWVNFNPEYSWTIGEQSLGNATKVVRKLSNPDYFINSGGLIQFREFQFIRGLRIVIETMNVKDCSFDLIEFSPRLFADITPAVSEFSVTKSLSDLGNGSIPVGSLSVATGSVQIFDIDFSFNENNVFNKETNTGSIVAEYSSVPSKFLFYDITRNVGDYDYFIPVKTMYNVEGFPQVTEYASLITINLRDFFFYLESQPAPEILITNVSLSYAVMLLLDYIGFDNIVFKRIINKPEIIIPYFYCAPNQNCAEALQQLAIASQSAMFFDEYNNFVVMSKEYLMPDSENERATDSFLLGQEDGENLPNIINLAAQDKKIYNSGRIDYTARYIERSVISTDQAPKLDRYKNYAYQKVKLWQVSGKQTTVTLNENPKQSGGYVLSAAPLNTSLPAEIPYVKNNKIYNNIMDLGENVQNIGSYEGFLYANGEIIKYDAIEFAVTSTGVNENIVWITNAQEYGYYMSKLPFNGKMYRTGNIRIYAKPEFETINGEVRMKDTSPELPMIEHGRGQFKTPIVEHSAGLIEDNFWTNNDNTFGTLQEASDYLFSINEYINYPEEIVLPSPEITPWFEEQDPDNLTQYVSLIPGGKNRDNFPNEGQYFDADALAKTSTRGGVVKNFLVDTLKTENEINYSKTTDLGTVQSSALIFTGPTIPSEIKSSNFISYVYKDLKTIGDPQGTTKPKPPIETIEVPSANRIIIRYNGDLFPWVNQDGSEIVSPPPGSVQPLNFSGIVRGAQYISSIDKNRLFIETESLLGMYLVGITGEMLSIEMLNQICNEMKQDANIKFVEPDTIITLSSSNNYSLVKSSGKTQVDQVIDSSDQNRFYDFIDKQTNLSKYTHFGTRMRIIGKIESNSKNQTALGNFEIFETSTSSDQEIKVYGGSGGIGFSLNKSIGTGYFFEIVALTVNNISDYTSSNAPKTSSFKILQTPAATCAGNVVTAYTENQIDFQVGQPVIVQGLVDANDPNNARTKLNGEHIISAINRDKKSFQYVINDSSVLNTTSKTGGDVYAVIPTNDNFANIFFYKVVPYDKKIIIKSYNRVNNIMTINTVDNHDFVVGDTVYVVVPPLESSAVDSSEKCIVKTVGEKTFTVSSIGENISGLNKYYSDNQVEKTAAIAAGSNGEEYYVHLTNALAIPYKLWSGLTQINVDAGTFLSQGKAYADTGGTTCYDLAAEYTNVGSSRKFFLYINNKQIASVIDDYPLPEYSGMCLFVRGSSKCAFENIYALGNNYSQNTSFTLDTAVGQVFGDDEIDATEALRKYALSGIIQKTYLSGIGSYESPKYALYFDEFGTIMRECAYFNIKYDRSYPALYAKLAKTYNQQRGYVASGFVAGSYGAEFLIFNSTDFNIIIDDSSINFLRIEGVAFTQNTTYSVSIDDYFKNKSKFIYNTINKGNIITDPNTILQEYNRIKNTRDKYGINEFSIQSEYIQTQDAANDIFGWIINKVSVPRKLVGINTFGTSNLQLGDIVTIDYQSNEGVNIISAPDKRFVVYNIEYKKDFSGLASTMYLVEV